MLSVLLISGHNVTPYLYDANVISAKEVVSMHQITNFLRIFQGASIDQYFLHFPFCWLNLTLPYFAIGLFLTHDSFPAPNREKKEKIWILTAAEMCCSDCIWLGEEMEEKERFWKRPAQWDGWRRQTALPPQGIIQQKFTSAKRCRF